MVTRIVLLCLVLSVSACTARGTEQANAGAAVTAEVLPDGTSAPSRSTATATATLPPATNTALPSPTPEPSETPTATVAPPADLAFHFVQEEPVVASGVSGGWDGRYINPGATFYHDGQFHMFRNGFVSWPGRVRVGYMHSADGITWEQPQTEPVLDSDDVPFAESGAAVSGGYVAPDGTWVLYFWTLGPSSAVGRATAPSPTGPWSIDPEPVLLPGGEGAWDRRGLQWPVVVPTGDELVLYYGAQHGLHLAIGRATSVDGINWHKYDDPATTEAAYAASDPVLAPDAEWTSGDANRPEVVLTADGWVMVHMGAALNRRGLAFSADGIHWNQYPENPVLTAEDFPVAGTTWDTALVHVEDSYFYFMEIGSGSGTDIYLATHQGRLHD